MAYVTTTQLSQRLGAEMYARLTDRSAGTTANAGVAQQILDEAEAVADSYLAQRYATPVDLSAHPEVANVLTVRMLDLAEWGAWKSSPFVSDPPQRVHRLHETALRWFEDVAQGRLVLPAAAPASPSTARADTPRWSGSARQFSSEELDGL